MWIRLGNIYAKGWAQLPVVQKINKNKVKIYFSKRIAGKSYPFSAIFSIRSKNILKTSNKPILSLGRPGSFDAAGVMPTHILRKGSKSILYYIGWTERKDVPFHNALGAAISKNNGRTWRKLSNGPIFACSKDEPGFIGTIEVLKVKNEYYGYYLSCRKWFKKSGKNEPVYDIKLAKSKNAIDWVPIGLAIKRKSNEGGLCKASIIRVQSKYYMWFCARGRIDYRKNPYEGYKIHCASSKNLIDWSRIRKFSLRNTNAFLNEDKMVGYPSVINCNNTLYMFYNGNSFGKTGIFLAKMGINKIEKIQNN